MSTRPRKPPKESRPSEMFPATPPVPFESSENLDPKWHLPKENENTQAGTSQTSTVREVIAHPSQDLALLLLSTPMTPANRNLFPEVATLRPTNNTSV